MRNRLPVLIAFIIVSTIVLMAFLLKSVADRPPEKVENTHEITRNTRLAAGLKHSIFIDGKGQLWTWGDSRYRSQPSPIPVKVADNACIAAAGDASRTSFYIDCNGTLYGWGDSQVGQIGRFSSTPITEPVPIMSDIRAIAPGYDTPFAIDIASTLWTWGKTNPSRGEEMPGEETGNNIDEPQKVMDLVKHVSSSATHTLALREDRSLWVWGKNESGQLATGSDIPQNRPYKANIAALDSKPVVKLATKNQASFAVTEDGGLYVWGYANATLPGRRYTTLEPKTLPVKVCFLDNVADIVVGDAGALILKKDGTVWAYGIGPVTETTDSNWKNPVRLMENVVEIATGPRHALALKKDGTVWSWGENDAGQLGDGTTENRFTPVQVHFPHQ